jgi:GT2 family glycosyltransferase
MPLPMIRLPLLSRPTVQIVRNSANYGFAQGYNEGIKQIDAEIYALVNSDIEVTEIGYPLLILLKPSQIQR